MSRAGSVPSVRAGIDHVYDVARSSRVKHEVCIVPIIIGVLLSFSKAGSEGSRVWHPQIVQAPAAPGAPPALRREDLDMIVEFCGKVATLRCGATPIVQMTLEETIVDACAAFFRCSQEGGEAVTMARTRMRMRASSNCSSISTTFLYISTMRAPQIATATRRSASWPGMWLRATFPSGETSSTSASRIAERDWARFHR